MNVRIIALSAGIIPGIKTIESPTQRPERGIHTFNKAQATNVQPGMGVAGAVGRPVMQHCPRKPSQQVVRFLLDASVTGSSLPYALTLANFRAFVLEHSSFLSLIQETFLEDLPCARHNGPPWARGSRCLSPGSFYHFSGSHLKSPSNLMSPSNNPLTNIKLSISRHAN